MSKQVAILLIRCLSIVLLRRRIQDVDSEPYWLSSDQYIERDGGVVLLPDKTGDMIAYAKHNKLRPLGIVVVHENGQYFEFFNDDAILSPLDREFARNLFQAHAHFWFCEFPWLMRGQTDA